MISLVVFFAFTATSSANQQCNAGCKAKDHSNDTYNQAPWDAHVKKDKWGFVALNDSIVSNLNWQDYLTYHWNLTIHKISFDNNADLEFQISIHNSLRQITNYFTPKMEQTIEMYDFNDIIQVATDRNHRNGM